MILSMWVVCAQIENSALSYCPCACTMTGCGKMLSPLLAFIQAAEGQ